MMEGQKGKAMKKYLCAISAGTVSAHVAYYADTPNKNYRIYYNGHDSGIRYEYLGNASRHLEQVTTVWRYNGAVAIDRKYATAADIPRRGWNA